MLTKPLFQKFIVYIIKNLCSKFGCHISSNNRDKQGGGIRPPQGIERFKSPRSDRVKDFEEKGMPENLKKSSKTGGRVSTTSDLYNNPKRVLFQAGNRQISQKFAEKGYSPSGT